MRIRPIAPLLALILVLGACGGPPTPTPRPSSSAPASSAPTQGASPTPLPSIDLPGEITAAGVREHLVALGQIAAEHGGVRTAGTAGYEASVDYVSSQLRAMGYEVEMPEFGTWAFEELPGAVIEVTGGGATFVAGDDFHAMIYSGGADVTAEVAVVHGGCQAGDWDDFPEGNIALVGYGPCRARDRVDQAQDAGAVALVAFNEGWEPGQARRPTLITPDGIDIPVISAVGEVGEALGIAAADDTEVRVAVDTEIRPVTLRDVVAQTPGGGDRVVMLGAHLDSVHDGPGINDNGSGVAAVLEIARLVADDELAGTLRFGFWGAEEFGLHGSRAYVQGLSGDERGRLAAYINLDMLGSVNGVPFVYRDSFAAPGSSEITDYLVGWLEAEGIGGEPRDLGGGSDHYFFAEAGIPTGGIFSGASDIKSSAEAESYGGVAGEPHDPCYHLACDTVDNVDAELVAAYAEAAARAALLASVGDLLGG